MNSTPEDKPVERTDGATGTPPVACTDKDQHLIGMWLRQYQSPHTQAAYTRDLKTFLDFAGNPTLDTITLPTLQAWQAHLADHLSLAVNSVNRKLTSVRSLLSFGHAHGYLAVNAGANLKSLIIPDKVQVAVLSEQDALTLMAATAGTPQGVRNTALLHILYYVGCQVSEAVSLTWRHLQLDSETPTIIIHGTGAQERTVALPPVCVHSLRRIRPAGELNPDLPVFRTQSGRDMDRYAVAKVVRAAGRRAGINTPVSPRGLRQAHAAHALARGAPVHLVHETLGSTPWARGHIPASPTRSSGHTLPGAIKCPEPHPPNASPTQLREC